MVPGLGLELELGPDQMGAGYSGDLGAEAEEEAACSEDCWAAAAEAATITIETTMPTTIIRHGCQMAIARFLESYVFGPSGFWTMAPLCYAAKFDPLLSLNCPTPQPSNPAQSKGRKGSNFEYWHLATLGLPGSLFFLPFGAAAPSIVVESVYWGNSDKWSVAAVGLKTSFPCSLRSATIRGAAAAATG